MVNINTDILVIWLGMRRSGNHAMINWFLDQFNGTTCFCNDNKLDERLRKIKRGELGVRNKVVLASYEDKSVKDFNRLRFKNAIQNNSIMHVLILRDPFNWLASWTKNAFKKSIAVQEHRWNTVDQYIDMWKEHAREFLGDTKHMGDKVTINYNDWFLKEEYRKEISQKVGDRFSDKTITEIFGWGAHRGAISSFENEEENVRDFALLDRWHYLKDMPQFKCLLDDELLSLSVRIFGETEAYLYCKQLKEAK